MERNMQSHSTQSKGLENLNKRLNKPSGCQEGTVVTTWKPYDWCGSK